jgi:hypothetical protein
MSLQISQIDDAVQLTLNNFIKKGSFLNMQTDLTDYVAVREMWKTRKNVFEGGIAWEFQVQMDHNHSAKTVGLFEQDSSVFNDTMTNGSVPVRHVNAHFIYDQREPDFQRGATKIVDLVQTRSSAMDSSFYELLEEQMWGKPATSSDDKSIFGIPYWIVKNSTTGLTGGNPAGFTSGAAGIDSTVYPRWKNYSAAYAAVTADDLLDKMRQAHLETQFRSPLSHSEPTLGGMKNGIYVNSTTHRALQKLFDTRNMNLGSDLGGQAVNFKSTAITYAPYLNNDSSNPVYMIDWKWMAVGCMAGWENNLTPPYMVPGKHTVRRVDRDASINMICTDRRRQTVLYIA